MTTLWLLIVIFVLIIYIIYLRMRNSIGKARFSGQIVVAMVTIVPVTLAATSIGFFDIVAYAIIQIFDLTNSSSKGSFKLESGISSIIAFMIIVGVNYLLYKFGCTVIKNWEGPRTRSELNLKDRKIVPNLISLAMEHYRLSFTNSRDIEINEHVFKNIETLPPVPELPSWREIARNCIISTDNDIDPEMTWLPQLRCWESSISQRRARNNGNLIYVVPVDENFSSFSEKAEEIFNRASGKIDRIVFCIDSDRSVNDEILNLERIKVKKISRTAMFNEALDLTYYCNSIIERFDVNTALGTSFSLSEMFTAPRIEKEEAVTDFLFSEIDYFLNQSNCEHLCVLGQYGQGKSTALLSYCNNWAKRWKREENRDIRIPLLITLRGRDPHSLSPLELLTIWGRKYRLDGGILMALIQSGHALLIFEGFDEVINAGLKSQRHNQFKALWSFAFPSSKIIFSGRPNFFLGEKEMNILLRNSGLLGAGGISSKKVYLSLFKRSQIEEALRPFNKEIRNGILEKFDNDPSFRDIARRPSMIPILALIWDKVAEEQNKGMLTNGKLIEIYCIFEINRKRGMVNFDYLSRGLRVEQNYIQMPDKVKMFFLEGVAFSMLQAGISNSISREKFEQTIKNLIPELVEEISKSETEIEEIQYHNKLKRDIQERGIDKVAETVATEVRATAILTLDPTSGVDHYHFPHKQFYEYFLCRKLLRISKKENPAIDEIKKAKLISSRENNALLFFADLSSGPVESMNIFSSKSAKFFTRFLSIFANYSNSEAYIMIQSSRYYNEDNSSLKEEKKLNYILAFAFIAVLAIITFYSLKFLFYPKIRTDFPSMFIIVSIMFTLPFIFSPVIEFLKITVFYFIAEREKFFMEAVLRRFQPLSIKETIRIINKRGLYKIDTSALSNARDREIEKQRKTV